MPTTPRSNQRDENSTSLRRGTLVGATAILLWATLAALTTLSGRIPPFQLLAMSFSLAFLIGLWLWRREGGPVRRHFRLPASVWALGLYGLFGYHFAYFMALRNAPPVEAGLIAYLWPLLIVLLAAFLPGERLRHHQMIGALAGFAGAALLVTRGQGLVFERQYLTGYSFALACALIWSSYSVLSRRAGHVPTSAVGAFCGATALLALVCHFLFETTVWPTGGQWPAVIALGLGPVGAAFYTWDFGVKRGNIQTLGAFAYAAPLLSTLLLIALGLAEPTWILAVACVLIVGGAFIAGR
jgi:drug/metabolite transporter (DMT)-like permease